MHIAEAISQQTIKYRRRTHFLAGYNDLNIFITNTGKIMQQHEKYIMIMSFPRKINYESKLGSSSSSSRSPKSL